MFDANNFSRVKLNEDFGTIYWDNGIDLCPDVLFDLGMQNQNDSTHVSSKSAASYKKYDETSADVQVVREKKK